MPQANYLAVLVCGIASMALGFVWYGPLFGKMWTKEMGWDTKTPQEREAAKKGMTKSYVLTFIGSLVMAYVFSNILSFAMNFNHEAGISAGMTAGFWTWLGFIAPVTLGNVLWAGKSWKFWTMTNAYNLLQLLIFGMILSLWM